MKNGIATPRPASSWASPTVTTIRIRRGAFEKRRMITNSTNDPSATDAISATGSAIQNDHNSSEMSETQRLAGTAPRSACAKLITLFDL